MGGATTGSRWLLSDDGSCDEILGPNALLQGRKVAMEGERAECVIAGRGGSRIRLAASHAPAFLGAKPEISAPDVTTPPRRGREHPRGPLGTPTPACFCCTDWNIFDLLSPFHPARTRRIPAPHEPDSHPLLNGPHRAFNIVCTTLRTQPSPFLHGGPGFLRQSKTRARVQGRVQNVVPLLTRRFIVFHVFLRNNLQPFGCMYIHM
jgi:hypothetical protein